MRYSKYGPLVARLRYVASHPPELPVPWASRTGNTTSLPSGAVLAEGTYTRSPLYRAERKMIRSIQTPWVFYSLQDVQDYATAVLQRASGHYSRADFPVQYVQGEPGSATYLAGVITVPIPVRQTTVLHEVAHHLTGTVYDHGDDFMGAYTFVLTQEMGESTAKKLVDNLQ